jgi:hypothetical protein
MSNIFRWESDWQIEFLPSKCQFLRVTKKPRSSLTIYDIHENKLERVDSDQCLRVAIHTTINWNTHWKHNQKGNSTKVFIQRNPQHCPQRTKDVCYTALLRSLPEYASTVWDPFNYVNIQQLESVQRRSAKFVMNDYR